MTSRNSNAGLLLVGSPAHSSSRYQLTQTDKIDNVIYSDEKLRSNRI